MAQTINPCWWVLAQLAGSSCGGLVMGLKLLLLLFFSSCVRDGKHLVLGWRCVCWKINGEGCFKGNYSFLLLGEVQGETGLLRANQGWVLG